MAPVTLWSYILRTYIYVDGFNLYYRAVKGTRYKWLDLKALFSKVLSSNNNIEVIKYFTAIVSGRDDPAQPIRQQTYIRALEKFVPELEVVYGQFLSHPLKAPLIKGDQITSRKPIFAQVIKTEEKGSDVNLAVHMLNDAWRDLYDCAVLVSNDSDLACSMEFIKSYCNKTVGLIIPPDCHPSKELIAKADFVKHIRPGGLKSSQLPINIPNSSIVKPATW